MNRTTVHYLLLLEYCQQIRMISSRIRVIKYSVVEHSHLTPMTFISVPSLTNFHSFGSMSEDNFKFRLPTHCLFSYGTVVGLKFRSCHPCYSFFNIGTTASLLFRATVSIVHLFLSVSQVLLILILSFKLITYFCLFN